MGIAVGAEPSLSAENQSGFHFDAETHIYTLNGVRIPSVTQVLEGAGIINYDFLPPEKRQIYLDRGRRVHAMTHYDDEGELDEETVDPGDRGFLKAWRDWRRVHGFRWSLIETPKCSHLYRYGGTLDRFSTDEVLVDVKSGHSPWWVAVQLAAYAALLEGEKINVRRALAVELHEDGTYRPVRASEMRQHLDTFYAALRLYHVKQEKRGAFI